MLTTTDISDSSEPNNLKQPYENQSVSKESSILPNPVNSVSGEEKSALSNSISAPGMIITVSVISLLVASLFGSMIFVYFKRRLNSSDIQIGPDLLVNVHRYYDDDDDNDSYRDIENDSSASIPHYTPNFEQEQINSQSSLSTSMAGPVIIHQSELSSFHCHPLIRGNDSRAVNNSLTSPFHQYQLDSPPSTSITTITPSSTITTSPISLPISIPLHNISNETSPRSSIPALATLLGYTKKSFHSSPAFSSITTIPSSSASSSAAPSPPGSSNLPSLSLPPLSPCHKF